MGRSPPASQARKTLLLRQFGSVRRIALANVAEIAAVGGIGEALATEILKVVGAVSGQRTDNG